MTNPIALDAEQACAVLDALGGTKAVSDLTHTSTSTVHSWRDNGMPKPRFDHVRLAAEARGKAKEIAEVLAALTTEEEPSLPFDGSAGMP